MRWFSNLKLGTKLLASFAAVTLLTGVVGYFGIKDMGEINGLLNDMYENNLHPIVFVSHADMEVISHGREVYHFMIESEKSEMDKIKQDISTHESKFKEYMDKFRKSKLTDQEKNLLSKVDDNWSKYITNVEKLLSLSYAGKNREAMVLAKGEVAKYYQVTSELLTEIVRENEKRAEQAYKQSDVVYANMSKILIGIVLACAVLSIGGGIFLTRSITKPINKVVEGLTDGSEQVASASSQVSSASQSLAEGASEQAAGIEETSSSIEEMSSMTRQNADNANQANLLMSETTKVVDEANRSMSELTGSMKEISAASEETAKIIKTIDEIAFQTNLLALNAAVEAARAGEAGAGFAVVADEVRNLAMRAADAAKNTANLIEGTVKKIKNGSDTVGKTNEAFSKVATGAKKVGELVGEISAASNEQAQGIDQINKAVSEMDKVVQKNAASAEESASAAEEMNAQAETMKGYVGELMALVGGRNGNGVVSAKGPRHVGTGTPQIKTIDHPPKAGIRNTLTSKFKKGNGKEIAPMAVHKAKEVRPEQVIPMEEASFKEF